MVVTNLSDAKERLEEIDARLDVMERWLWHRRLYLWFLEKKRKLFG